MSINIFEQASRLKLRFPSNVGQLTTEQLWDLPLTTTRSNQACLQNVAQRLHEVISRATTIDFVGSTQNTTTQEELGLEVVKRVIAVRKEENEAKQAAKSKASELAYLESLLTTKKQEEDSKLTPAEIAQRIKELQA